MALIKWYEVATNDDCLEDDATWNDMITYIQHSACTDFTIYETCPGTGQAFRFTTSGDFSVIYGHEDAGKDLLIVANDSNMRPRISLFGDSSIHLDTADAILFKLDNTEFLNFNVDGTDDVIEGKTAGNDLKIVGVEGIHNYFKAGEEFKLFDDTDEALKITFDTNVTTVEGSDDTGGALVLKGNSVDDYSKIVIYGNSNMEFYVPDGGGIFKFYDGADWCGFMQDDVGNTSFVIGTQDDKDLWLNPNGTGYVRFGTYAAITAETLAGYITIHDDGGNVRKLAIVA